MSNEINALAFFGVEILHSGLSGLTEHNLSETMVDDRSPLKSIPLHLGSLFYSNISPGEDEIWSDVVFYQKQKVQWKNVETARLSLFLWAE